MKFKLIAALLILIIAVCVVGCNSNEGENTRDTVYLTVTYDQFADNVKKFTPVANYDDVNGYKFDLSYKSDVTGNMFNFTAEGVLDISNFDDVAFSISCLREYNQMPSDGNGNEQEGNSGTVTVAAVYNSRTVYNAYLYNHTLYVDLKENNKPIQKDSVKNINNSFADILALITGDSAFDFDGYAGKAVDILNDFSDYTNILYCEKLGHYIINVNFSEGGEINDKEIDPFTISADLYVKDDRITELSVNVKFIGRGVEIKGAIKEDEGNIDRPENPDSYTGKLLDEIEQILLAKEADFYGEWKGYINSDEDYCVLKFSGQKDATLTVVTAEGEEVIALEKKGFRWGILTLASEKGNYLLQLDGEAIRLTAPDGSEVYMAQIVAE